METVKAKCLSTKKLANGMKSASFECCLISLEVNQCPDGYLNKKIITANKELEVEWIAEGDALDPMLWKDPPYRLRKIRLVKHNRNIFGNIVINSLTWKMRGRSDHTADFKAKVVNFDTNNSLKPEDEQCNVLGFKVKLVISIYYADETTKRAATASTSRANLLTDEDVLPRKRVKNTNTDVIEIL